MSFMARMRSFTGSLETFPILSTMDAGMSIHPSLGQVLAEIGKARAFFCQLLVVRRQRIQPLFVLVAVIKRARLAVRLELVESARFWLRPVLLLVFRHLLGNSFSILVPSYAPFRLRFLCCSSWSRRSDSF